MTSGSSAPRFYGKYRGKVAQNIDPQNLGRVQVSCAAVLGSGQLSWAMPCTPFAGSGVGFFAVPPVGADVWVEFEAGDPDQPIWSGGFWATGDPPKLPALPQFKVFKTDAVSITITDLPGAGSLEIELKPPAVTSPMKLSFGASGIEISNGSSSIKLTMASVSVNNGALEVV